MRVQPAKRAYHTPMARKRSGCGGIFDNQRFGWLDAHRAAFLVDAVTLVIKKSNVVSCKIVRHKILIRACGGAHSVAATGHEHILGRPRCAACARRATRELRRTKRKKKLINRKRQQGRTHHRGVRPLTRQLRAHGSWRTGIWPWCLGAKPQWSGPSRRPGGLSRSWEQAASGHRVS